MHFVSTICRFVRVTSQDKAQSFPLAHNWNKWQQIAQKSTYGELFLKKKWTNTDLQAFRSTLHCYQLHFFSKWKLVHNVNKPTIYLGSAVSSGICMPHLHVNLQNHETDCVLTWRVKPLNCSHCFLNFVSSATPRRLKTRRTNVPDMCPNQTLMRSTQIFRVPLFAANWQFWWVTKNENKGFFLLFHHLQLQLSFTETIAECKSRLHVYARTHTHRTDHERGRRIRVTKADKNNTVNNLSKR